MVLFHVTHDIYMLTLSRTDPWTRLLASDPSDLLNLGHICMIRTTCADKTRTRFERCTNASVDTPLCSLYITHGMLLIGDLS
jgi:hypothetical protein